ncbi:MAG TPA: hypothetical protein EYQ21_04900 [Flavobacteriales bacterium]|nr:hypothetical protein [Flavobacteriales bacterium]
MKYVIAQPCLTCDCDGISYMSDSSGMMNFETKAKAKEFLQENITWEECGREFGSLSEFEFYLEQIMIIPASEVSHKYEGDK